MRRVISLSTSNWRLGSVSSQPFAPVNDRAQVTEWLDAHVPGDVHLDLLRAGKISDPFFDRNNESSQWVDERDWWYVCALPNKLTTNERARVFLLCEGIDYQSALFVNAQFVGSHIGMFSPHAYELTALLNANAENEIAMRVWGAHALPKWKLSGLERLWRPLASLLLPSNPAFPPRTATLKTQMSFGWDFAPRLLTCGIWDDLQLVVTREIFIRDVQVTSPTSNVVVVATIDAVREIETQIEIHIDGEIKIRGPRKLERGVRTYRFEFVIDSPRLWDPWDRGEPNLYELEFIVAESNALLDSYTTRFGIRTIALTGEHARSKWSVRVNHEREFLRGANWVPPDALPGRVTRDDYSELLHMAKDAGINALRVWGGGLREKRAFYDLCDELGILVWQEFPFANALLDWFPRTREHLAFVESECTAIVRALRNHPSLFLWSGGNEINTRPNQHVVKKLRAVVETHDGTRAFKSSSPTYGEVHSWRVWHGFANTRDYRQVEGGMLSEFGLQSAPARASLEQFLPREKLFPPNASWEYHHAQLKKLWRYARAIHAEIRTLDEFITATQTAQMRGLQIAIEHARRNKKKFDGCLFWQFNEPWSAISWSVVDYYRRPKRAYEKIKQIFQPVLIAFEYELEPRRAGERLTGTVWVVNDSLQTWYDASIRVYFNRAEIERGRANLPPASVTRVGNVTLTLDAGANNLRLELQADAQPLADNEYDLNYCDAGTSSFAARVSARLGEILMK